MRDKLNIVLDLLANKYPDEYLYYHEAKKDYQTKIIKEVTIKELLYLDGIGILRGSRIEELYNKITNAEKYATVEEFLDRLGKLPGGHYILPECSLDLLHTMLSAYNRTALLWPLGFSLLLILDQKGTSHANN